MSPKDSLSIIKTVAVDVLSLENLKACIENDFHFLHMNKVTSGPQPPKTFIVVSKL